MGISCSCSGAGLPLIFPSTSRSTSARSLVHISALSGLMMKREGTGFAIICSSSCSLIAFISRPALSLTVRTTASSPRTELSVSSQKRILDFTDSGIVSSEASARMSMIFRPVRPQRRAFLMDSLVSIHSETGPERLGSAIAWIGILCLPPAITVKSDDTTSDSRSFPSLRP